MIDPRRAAGERRRRARRRRRGARPARAGRAAAGRRAAVRLARARSTRAGSLPFARTRAAELRAYVVVFDSPRRRAFAVDPDGAVVCGTFGAFELAAFTFERRAHRRMEGCAGDRRTRRSRASRERSPRSRGDVSDDARLSKARTKKHGREGPRWVPIAAAVLAVLAAVSGYFGNRRSTQALFAKNEAIVATTHASDTFAQYQAERLKYYVSQSALDQGLNPGGKADKLKANAAREKAKGPALLARAQRSTRRPIARTRARNGCSAKPRRLRSARRCSRLGSCSSRSPR